MILDNAFLALCENYRSIWWRFYKLIRFKTKKKPAKNVVLKNLQYADNFAIMYGSKENLQNHTLAGNTWKIWFRNKLETILKLNTNDTDTTKFLFKWHKTTECRYLQISRELYQKKFKTRQWNHIQVTETRIHREDNYFIEYLITKI